MLQCSKFKNVSDREFDQIRTLVICKKYSIPTFDNHLIFPLGNLFFVYKYVSTF